MCNTPSNEDVHESAKDEDKEAGVQCGADIGKVPLGLSRENVLLNCNAIRTPTWNVKAVRPTTTAAVKKNACKAVCQPNIQDIIQCPLLHKVRFHT